MSKFKRLVAYSLLFVFGFLSLKNLLPTIDGSLGNCQEFGHIHISKSAHKHPVKLNINAIDRTSNPADDDDDCHEGKSVLTFSTLPNAVFDVIHPEYKLEYKLVFNFENNFKSPYLEPHRKPPKVS